MQQPLKVTEVASLLRVSVRTARDLPIPFSRVGRQRRYDIRDVEKFMKQNVECPSPVEPHRPVSENSSSYSVVGFSEALKQAPAIKEA